MKPLARRILLAVSIAGSLLGTAPALARKDALSSGARITGKVLLGGAGHPVEGSVVTAVHLDSGELFKSVPAGRDGSYAIKGLPYGYYSFAIEADGVLHAAPGPTNLVPSQREHFDFLLRRPAVASSHDAPSIGTGTRLPGLAQAATGTAEIVGLPSEVPFARTPAGIATIVGSVVLALLLLG